MAHSGEERLLNLPNTFCGEVELSASVSQSPSTAVLKTEPLAENVDVALLELEEKLQEQPRKILGFLQNSLRLFADVAIAINGGEQATHTPWV